jgi:hypothetical protein
MDDRDDIFGFGAEPCSEFDKPGPFRGRYFDPFGDLATKNSILSFEILDDLDQFFFGRTSQKQHVCYGAP